MPSRVFTTMVHPHSAQPLQTTDEDEVQPTRASAEYILMLASTKPPAVECWCIVAVNAVEMDKPGNIPFL